MTTAHKPKLLKALAGIGILFGALGSMYAAASVGEFLTDRDEFINRYQKAVEARMEALTPSPSPSPSPSPNAVASPLPDLSKVPEQIANKIYARRGVTLPLSAVNLILSMLLLVGCLRALRGTAWGLSAWNLACLASIPYQVLSAASTALQTNDVMPLFGEPTGPYVAFALVWMTVCILYYGVCLIYLRRPQIRALFR